jgi:hypothetical protein
MGEDTLRVLTEYLRLHAHIQAEVIAEIPLSRIATRWSALMKIAEIPELARRTEGGAVVLPLVHISELDAEIISRRWQPEGGDQCAKEWGVL